MTAQELVERLRQLDADGSVHFVTIAAGDPRLDRSTLPDPTPCGLSAMDHGQVDDLRYSIDGQSLHELRYRDHSQWHLDRVDACEAPIRHFIADTNAPTRAAVGGLLGAGVGALTRRRRAWMYLGVAGVLLGGLTAGPRGDVVRITFEDLESGE